MTEEKCVVCGIPIPIPALEHQTREGTVCGGCRTTNPDHHGTIQIKHGFQTAAEMLEDHQEGRRA